MQQRTKVIKALIENPKKIFKATDFQYGDYFIGYEATARISEIISMYPDYVIVGKEKRFRTIKLNEENKEGIKYFDDLVRSEEYGV